MERRDAFVNCSQLLWIVADMVTALAADTTYAIVVAQAALQFVQVLLEHIKKQPPTSLDNSGGCFF